MLLLLWPRRAEDEGKQGESERDGRSEERPGDPAPSPDGSGCDAPPDPSGDPDDKGPENLVAGMADPGTT